MQYLTRRLKNRISVKNYSTTADKRLFACWRGVLTPIKMTSLIIDTRNFSPEFPKFRSIGVNKNSKIVYKLLFILTAITET